MKQVSALKVRAEIAGSKKTKTALKEKTITLKMEYINNE